MRRPMTWLLLLACGCSSEIVQTTAGEPADCEAYIDEACVGADTVETEVAGPCSCDGDGRQVTTAEQLAAEASRGGCLNLADGNYGDVVVPAGVKLVGASVAGVVMTKLSLRSASACKLTVEGGGVTASGPAQLQYAVVRDSAQDAISLEAGASLSLVGSTVDGWGRGSVNARDVERLDMQRVLIRAHDDAYLSQQSGVWLTCSDGCACSAARPSGQLSHVVVSGASMIGMSIIGSTVALEHVRIERSTVGGNFQDGGGLAVSGCSDVSASDLQLIDNADFGLLVDDSAFSGDAVRAEGNLRGVWLQNVGNSAQQTASLSHAELVDNQAVGVGLRTGSYAVSDTRITDTTTVALPCLIDGVTASSESVADGLSWGRGAVATVERVTIGASGRIPLLIDGPARGTIADVRLEDGDEALGMLQVCYGGGDQPKVSNSPPLTTYAADCFCVPEDVVVPPNVLE